MAKNLIHWSQKGYKLIIRWFYVKRWSVDLDLTEFLNNSRKLLKSQLDWIWFLSTQSPIVMQLISPERHVADKPSVSWDWTGWRFQALSWKTLAPRHARVFWHRSSLGKIPREWKMHFIKETMTAARKMELIKSWSFTWRIMAFPGEDSIIRDEYLRRWE